MKLAERLTVVGHVRSIPAGVARASPAGGAGGGADDQPQNGASYCSSRFPWEDFSAFDQNFIRFPGGLLRYDAKGDQYILSVEMSEMNGASGQTLGELERLLVRDRMRRDWIASF